MPKRSPLPRVKSPRLNPGLDADSTIKRLVCSRLLDQLSGPQAVVYLKLLVAVSNQRTTRVVVANAELHQNRDGRTAAQALRELESKHGLCRIHWDDKHQRSIEVR